MNWYGWIFDDGAWQRATGSHPTLGTCSDALGIVAKQRGVAAKFTCMTTGGVPRFTPGESSSLAGDAGAPAGATEEAR